MAHDVRNAKAIYLYDTNLAQRNEITVALHRRPGDIRAFDVSAPPVNIIKIIQPQIVAGVFVYKPKGKPIMSDITISRPEVVTGHTDVICSTSIQHVVTVRNAALQQTETLIRQLAEISADSRHWYHRPGLGDETEFSLWLLADVNSPSVPM
jgi:hypothetical protein